MRFLCWEIRRMDTIRKLLEDGQKLSAIKLYREKYPKLTFGQVVEKFYRKYLPGQPIPGGGKKC